MFKVEYKENENRLYMTLEGFIKKDEATRFKEAGIKETEKTKPGYTFLIDAVNLNTLPSDSMEEIQKLRSHAVKKGCRKGAMIIQSATLKMQSERTLKYVEAAFEERYFDNLDEAFKFLNSK